ncbi:MAG: hypothetical protein ACTHJX_15170 [Terriglobales bacterium]
MPRAAAMLVLLSLVASAQQRGTRGRSLNSNPTATVDPALIAALYQDAKQAIADAPALIGPRLLTDIARDETRPMFRGRGNATDAPPDPGLADFAAAFELARALPLPADGDPAQAAALSIKTNAESDAVAELARRGQLTQALQLARRADVPKGPLYDQLIMSTDRAWRRDNSDNNNDNAGDAAEESTTDSTADAANAAQAEQDRLDTVFTLVQECKRADGTYPYRGMAFFLRGEAPASLERTALILDGYHWATAESDRARLSAAAQFLAAGHRAAPGLDPQLTSALTTLLDHLGNTTQGSSRPLLNLLRTVDPQRADDEAQRWPALGTLAAEPPAPEISLSALGSALSFSGPGGNRFVVGGSFARGNRGGSAQSGTIEVVVPQGSQFSMSVNVTAPLPDPSDQPAGAAQFRMLLARAEMAARRLPAEARSFADQAAGLLDAGLWSSQAAVATRLAQVYQQLSDRPDAARILARALDQADADARAADQQYLGDSSRQPQLAQDLEKLAAPVIEIYSLAARVDFETTARRAEQAQYVILKPMVLARIALVGQIGQFRGRGN